MSAGQSSHRTAEVSVEPVNLSIFDELYGNAAFAGGGLPREPFAPQSPARDGFPTGILIVVQGNGELTLDTAR